MSQNRVRIYAIFFLILGVLFWRVKGNEIMFPLLSVKGAKALESKGVSPEDPYSRLLELHKKKTYPGPHDWLASHPEPGQTFKEYQGSNPVRPTKNRNKIYFVLLGHFDRVDREVLEKTAQYTEAFYGLEVKFDNPISLDVIPQEARRVNPFTRQEQILTSFVMEDLLKDNKPEDAICYIAFTTADLWPGEGWNFVFGQASWEDAIGVMSVARYGDPKKGPHEYQLFLRRTIATGVHEIAHMFNLWHCIFYECAINGSNHMQEADSRPLWICPVCLKKLAWALKLDPEKRYQDLHKLAVDYGFLKEAKFFKRSENIFKKE